MDAQTVGAPGGFVAPNASAEHPLVGLGLGTENPDGPALQAALGYMPGAAEAQVVREADYNEQLQAWAASQMPQNVPDPRAAAAPVVPPAVQPVPQLTEQQRAAMFNQQMAQQAGQPEDYFQPQPGQPQPGQPAQTPSQQDDVVLSNDDYNFLVGLIEDQGAAIQGYSGGQTPTPGPAAIPQNSFVAPGMAAAPPQQAPVGPAVAPLNVPNVNAQEISDVEFEKLTTDRAAFQSYLAARDQGIAATVTEQLSQTILPHVFTRMEGQFNRQHAIDGFLAANPDLAEHPEALKSAVAEAKVALPYAKDDRLLYYAARKLRGAVATNQQIDSNVHDLRGPAPAGRRVTPMNPATPLRRGPGNTPPVNPFDVMKQDLIERNAGSDGDILRQLGIG